MRSIHWLGLFLSAAPLLLCGCGGGPGPVSIQPPPTLTYTTGTAIYTVGVAITPNSPTSTGGAASAYSVSPDLPAGLSLDDDTGIITGTPTAVSAKANYTVTASNLTGSATTTLTITVNAAAAGVQFIPNMNQWITPLAPQGAQFQSLVTPWLVNGNPWLAGQGVSSVVSGSTLLVLTSGFNRIFNGGSISNLAFVPDPPIVELAPGQSSAPGGLPANSPSREYVFVYDISAGAPVYKQVVMLPNSYHGIAFDPSQNAFFFDTFTSGGYYSVQPPGSNLLLIGLNSNSFVDGAPTAADANTELDWLNSQLAAAQAARQKVWILMHVPAGANPEVTALNAAKAGTPGQVNKTTTSMMWDLGYQATFLQTLADYPGVVTLMLAGHTHMDEYRILPTGNVLEQLPSISPCFGNNPAFKVLTIAKDTLTATDYNSFYYDLTSMPGQFNCLYQLSATYGASGPLNSSLQQLYPRLVGNPTQREAYIHYYDSGNTALNPVTKAPWNPINNTNWPIFACTISKTGEPDYINCVNTY